MDGVLCESEMASSLSRQEPECRESCSRRICKILGPQEVRVERLIWNPLQNQGHAFEMPRTSLSREPLGSWYVENHRYYCLWL